MEKDRTPAIAVIGCGYWGKNLVRNFAKLQALSVCCDATPAGRAAAAEIAPQTPAVGDFREVLDSDIEGVVIATPAEAHYEMASAALAAGKDVMVEKPLALTYEDGAALVRLAEENGCMLMVGHVLEYHPAIVKLHQLIHADELGKVRYISSNRLNLGKVRREENILWSFAPHDVAVILRLMHGMPFQISAHGGSYVQPNIADVTITHMLFDNGVRAHIYVSWLHPFKEQRLVVIGSKKMASFDDVTKHLVLYDQRVEVHEGVPVPIKGTGELVEFHNEEPLRLECRAFLRSIQTRQQPLTDGRSGLRVLQVLQTAQRSLVMNGEPLTFPVESEQGVTVFS
jgi:predicted dehydrogenase